MSGIPFFLCFTFVFYGFVWGFLICECTPRNDKKGLRNRLCHSNRDLENIFWICFFFSFHVLFLFSLSFGEISIPCEIYHSVSEFLSIFSFFFKKKKTVLKQVCVSDAMVRTKKERDSTCSTLSDKRYD